MPDPLTFQHFHAPDLAHSKDENEEAAMHGYLARVEADGYYPLGPPLVRPGVGVAEGLLVATGTVKRLGSPADYGLLTDVGMAPEPELTVTPLGDVQDGDMVQVVMNAQNARWLERVLRVRRLDLFPIPVSDDLPTFGIGMRDDDND